MTLKEFETIIDLNEVKLNVILLRNNDYGTLLGITDISSIGKDNLKIQGNIEINKDGNEIDVYVVKEV